MLATDAC